MGIIKVFTKKVEEGCYPLAIANSIHFSYSDDGLDFVELNHGYGILFAEAAIREDNTLEERGLINPQIQKRDGDYLVTATLADAEGMPVMPETIVTFTTKDFVHFERQALANEKKAACDSVEIPDSLREGIYERWIPLQAVEVNFPNRIQLSEVEEIVSVKASVEYSDGSCHEKRVMWDMQSLTPLGEDNYEIHGKLQAVHTGFPLAAGFADPVFFQWKGSWYYVATNDNLNDIGIYVRRAESVEGLFAENVEQKCILDYDKERKLCQTFWAPEFHVIGERLYLLFAVSGEVWGPQCHMMRLREGGDILKPEDWEEPVRVCRADGSDLAGEGITLDMTFFRTNKKTYLCWSYRYGIGTPSDTGSMLCIAEADEAKPWILASNPVLISRPLLGWENVAGTINNEGPYALILGDMLYLAYSGGAATGYTYAVGYLKASMDADLLDVSSWTKEPTAVLASGYVDGIQGPGHNSFFQDEAGNLMIAYHAQEREKYFCRCSAFHRVHISKNGFPLLDVVGNRDVAEEMADVSVTFTLCS